MRGIHRWSVDSPHKGPVTRKMFPFDDVIMILEVYCKYASSHRLSIFYTKQVIDVYRYQQPISWVVNSYKSKAADTLMQLINQSCVTLELRKYGWVPLTNSLREVEVILHVLYVYFKLVSRIDISITSCESRVIWCECHRAPLLISQRCFRRWLGAVKH